MYDTIIIGGGTAGLGAALYATRFKLNTLVIAKDYGGTGNEAHLVDNWIGDPGITGMKLMEKFISHVKSYGVPLVEGEVQEARKAAKGFKVTLSDGKAYDAKTLILSSGMKHKHLGVPGEEALAGRGVSYCYTCDAAFFKNKIVGVVGGSDSAAQAALLCAEYATNVIVMYRKERLRAEPITAEQVYAHKKIKVMHNVNVTKINGAKKVEGVTLDTGEDIKMDGVFVEIGSVPVVAIPKSLSVELDERDFVKVDNEGRTNVSGVFAAGDMTNSTTLKQFITSAADGSKAAQSAYYYVQKGPKLEGWT